MDEIEENKLMSITRCLSPPTDNPIEIIYIGEWLDSKKIKKVVNIGPEEPRKYFYGISRLEVKDNSLVIHVKTADYNEILNPSCIGSYGNSTSLELNDPFKKGLTKLLQSKD